jgi:thiamine transport system permease protein
MRLFWIAPALIVVAIALGVIPLVYFAIARGGVVLPDSYVWRVLRFTLLQASLSTMLSVLPAIFIARALARQHFRGRTMLLAALSIPLSLPVIVAVFGITALYGTTGYFGGWFNLYGPTGIILAHVFFNLPLATRLLFECLQSATAENHRLAAQLNFSNIAVFKHLDWPLLRSSLPRICALIFLLCASSFVIVLIFGGPQATTLEVAIFQSLRMDFDVSRALTLAVVQILLSTILVWAAAQTLKTSEVPSSNRSFVERYDGTSWRLRLLDFLLIAFVSALVLPILLSIALQGVGHFQFSAIFLSALLTSFGLAVLTCIFSLPLAWGLAKAQLRLPQRGGILTSLSFVSYAVPPAVISTGWFLVFRHIDGGIIIAVLLISALNSLMVLPFLMAVLVPAMSQVTAHHDRLCAQLSISGWARLRLIDVPALRGPLSQAVLMAMVLSMGDLTAVTLLGTSGLVTLPSLVQQQMGHYQFNAAGGTALVLALMCFLMSFLAQRVARWT